MYPHPPPPPPPPPAYNIKKNLKTSLPPRPPPYTPMSLMYGPIDVLNRYIIFAAEYLWNVLPPIRRPMYIGICGNTYNDIPCRKTKYKNSFFPNSIKTWNCLIEKIQACTSLNNFKCNLISLVRPKPNSTFDITRSNFVPN